MPPPQPVRVPPPTPSDRKASTSTRQVSWDEYGKEIVEAVSAVVAQGGPSSEQGLTDTDALLAAYLTEQPPNETADAAAARSAGLRWDRGSSAGGSTGGHVTGGPPSTAPPSGSRGVTPSTAPSTGLSAAPSTAGHSTGHHSTGGHSTGGHSTGGHSTGGHSTGGHSTGGHSAGRDRASTQKAMPRVGGGLRWEGRSSPGRDIESSAGQNIVERESSGGAHAGSSPSREVDRNAAGRSSQDASSQGASSPGRSSQGSAQGRSSGQGSSGARGSWGERSSQGGQGSHSNPGHDPNQPPSLRGRAKAGSQAWGSSRRDKK